MTGVEVVDPSTVRLTLKAPFAPLTGVLADRSGMIMSPTQLTKLGADFGSSPVCVGPFSFVSRQAGNEIKLQKSTSYYDADKVKLDTVTYRVINDANVRLANVRSGDVQIAERITPTDVAKVQGDSALRLVTGAPLGYQGISINVGNTAGVGQPVGQVSSRSARPRSCARRSSSRWTATPSTRSRSPASTSPAAPRSRRARRSWTTRSSAPSATSRRPRRSSPTAARPPRSPSR